MLRHDNISFHILGALLWKISWSIRGMIYAVTRTDRGLADSQLLRQLNTILGRQCNELLQGTAHSKNKLTDLHCLVKTPNQSCTVPTTGRSFETLLTRCRSTVKVKKKYPSVCLDYLGMSNPDVIHNHTYRLPCLATQRRECPIPDAILTNV